MKLPQTPILILIFLFLCSCGEIPSKLKDKTPAKNQENRNKKEEDKESFKDKIKDSSIIKPSSKKPKRTKSLDTLKPKIATELKQLQEAKDAKISSR